MMYNKKEVSGITKYVYWKKGKASSVPKKKGNIGVQDRNDCKKLRNNFM